MADKTVDIKEMKFVPLKIEVDLGSKVKWHNLDRISHTATADDGSWDTGEIKAGQTSEVQFKTIGTHPYHCEYHPEMVGTVVAIEF